MVRSLSSENITGYTAFGAQGSNPQFQNPFVINPKINYSIQKGRNSIKLGYEFLAINTEIDDFNPVYGQETYNGAFSQCVTGANTNVCTGSTAANAVSPADTGAKGSHLLHRLPDRCAFHLPAE